MTSTRSRPLAVLATIAALAVVAPIASAAAVAPAQALPGPGVPVGTIPPCFGSYSPSGVGDSGATFTQVCGSGLTFVGPAVGQVATVVAPTIIGSVVNAPISVSAGPIAAAAVP